MVAEKVEVPVLSEDAVQLHEEFTKTGVGKNRKPVVAGRLAVLESGGRSNCPVFLEALVRGVRNEQIQARRLKRFQPSDGIAPMNVKNIMHFKRLAGEALGQKKLALTLIG